MADTGKWGFALGLLVFLFLFLFSFKIKTKAVSLCLIGGPPWNLILCPPRSTQLESRSELLLY